MQKIEISSKTIIFTVLFLLSLKFLWVIRDLIFSLFIAFIVMSALKPLVLSLVKRKIPKTLSVSIIYVFFLGLLIFFVTLIFPPLIGEASALFKNLPSIIQDISPSLAVLNLDLSQFIFNLSNQFLNLAKNIFENTVFVISTIFFGFYFLLDPALVDNLAKKFFEEDRAYQIVEIFNKAERRLSSWFWGELILMVIIGVMTFIGLSLMGIKYALALAVLAGLLEIIPNLGPVISAIPAVLIALSQSYFLGFAIVALYFLIHQLENNLVVPFVMKKAVGLNPIVTLMALIVGGKLAGIIGVLLAIPTTLFIESVLVEVLKPQRVTGSLR